MNPTALVRSVVALLVVLMVGTVGTMLWRSAGDRQKLDAATDVIKQQDAAATATAKLQGKVDAANSKLRAADAARAAARELLAAAERGVRQSAPDAGAYSNASVEALRQYAASLDRDFERCREEYARVVDEAAAASDAAHALNDAWPDADAWSKAAQAFALKGLTK